MKSDQKVLLIIALGYFLLIFTILSFYHFNFSSRIYLTSDLITNYQKEIPKNLVLYTSNSGFDGNYYYLISADLFRSHIIIHPLRYQRILYPLVVRIFSFNQIDMIPFTMIYINYLSIIIGAFFMLLIFKKYKSKNYYVYIWAINVGLIISFVRDLSEPLMILGVIIGLWCLEEKKYLLSSVFFSLAIMTKEIVIIILIPILIYQLYKKEYLIFAYYLTPILIFIIWQVIIYLEFGDSPLINILMRPVSIPLIGFIAVILNYGSLTRLDWYFFIAKSLITIFALAQIYLLIKNKSKNKSVYYFVLMFQSIILVHFSEIRIIWYIEDIGRYAIGMFLFSILYYVEKKEEYPTLLLILSILITLSFLMPEVYYIMTHKFIISS
ncbi:hypothetical protein COU57_06170 [Candidatus Pacearchaeota archaeon CG10_big_fil_rev_8_21_14_0_10_32_14]|nr:MAG: hypothetical protein COU57_06170 [Candidatus Pacearchaeota archaeon CG10_big_fil_rev_8_21_14_0_10_32_14]